MEARTGLIESQIASPTPAASLISEASPTSAVVKRTVRLVVLPANGRVRGLRVSDEEVIALERCTLVNALAVMQGFARCQ